ncbi:hypothetical protein ACQWFX_24555, partial [Salmonella enterica subsp. enterica serovar Infantis]
VLRGSRLVLKYFFVSTLLFMLVFCVWVVGLRLWGAWVFLGVVFGGLVFGGVCVVVWLFVGQVR